MDNLSYSKIISQNNRLIVLTAVIAMLFAVGLSFARPLQYSSTVRLLVIQKAAGLDPYTAIRSAERISDNLAQIIYTTSFFEQVLRSGFGIDERFFSADERKRRREWRTMITTQVARGTGMLAVTVYHRDKAQASQIAQAVAYVLTIKGTEYVGGDLSVRLVDAPLESRFPVRPNIPANAFSGLVLGTIAGIGFVLARFYLQEEKAGHAPNFHRSA